MALGCAVTTFAAQAAIELDIAGLTPIQFKNSTFQIGAPGTTFVTSSTGDNANGDFGTLSTGPFSFGPITIDGISGNQSAPITTPPSTTITISDGVGGMLTGNLTWGTITTFGANSIGGISDQLNVNVTGLAYSGSAQSLLQEFANAGSGTFILSFQFADHKKLTDLANLTVWTGTTYSASLTAVPEPSTYLAGLSAISMLGLFGWRVRK